MGPEIWKPVPGLGVDWVEASSEGNVRTLTHSATFVRQGREVVLRCQGRPVPVYLHLGRRRCGIRINGVAKQFAIPRLVCAAFHGEPQGERTDCAHNNGICTDDRAANLRWATQKENDDDKDVHGTRPLGTACHLAKLDEGKVRVARALLAEGIGRPEVARRVGVTTAAIWQLDKGRTWKHVT